MKKILTIILSYLLLIFNSNVKPDEDNKNLKIGLIAPLSGEYKELGNSLLYSLQLALSEIGDENVFREGVTVHRGTIQDKSITVIGSKNLFMAYAHVAHDCVVGNNNVFANNAGIAGHVTVGSNVTIGALTTIHQFCRMGDYSFAGMNASITMDVPSYIKVASNPARVVGLNSIGMERGGIDQETITILKKAYKIIYRKGFNLNDAIEKVISMNTNNLKEVQNFVDSIKSSERGILR